MANRWLGITVSSSAVVIVAAEEVGKALSLVADETWHLQESSRPHAYQVIAEVIQDFIKNNGIAHVRIKGSAVNRGGTSLAHLESAELRGVVAGAAAVHAADVAFVQKAAVSKTFGTRKADEYLADANFFTSKFTARKPLRAGSREAALILIAEFEK